MVKRDEIRAMREIAKKLAHDRLASSTQDDDEKGITRRDMSFSGLRSTYIFSPFLVRAIEGLQTGLGTVEDIHNATKLV